ncbi:T9SS type A sorting domain-containing protein [bacterium]|nr:T9SS type A sorting domain-containing protein [bacterium]
MRRASLALVAILLLPLTIAAAEVVTLNGGAEAVAATVMESNDFRTVIEYELGSFAKSPIVIGGETYYSVLLDGEPHSSEKGLPELPLVARSIIIPNDAAMEIRVLGSTYVDFENVPVAPSKGAILRSIDPATVAHTFDAFYQSDGWYPSEVAFARDPYIMRDVRGLTIVINPFQYNPSTQTLRVHTSLIVEARSTGSGRTNVLTSDGMRSRVAEFERFYSRHFMNYTEARMDRYASVDEAGSMLIIAYDSFMTTMEPLVEWKKQMGVPCEMVSVATAGGSATAIKSYIQSYYDAGDLAYVLLVGDAAQVPTLTGGGGSSDPSYSLLAGSDNYPEIFVGRFSAESVADVETQVTRSVEYEKYPQSGGAWYHKGMGVASNQGPGDDGEYDNVHVDNIRADLLGFTYTEVDQIYDPSGTAAMVTSGLNGGRSVINYCGHGSTTSWSSTGFSNTQVNALTNDNMLPFIVSVACVNGNFANYTCFGEAWLRATNGTEPTGAIGAYMSSINQEWNPPMQAQDEVVDLLIVEEKLTFGGLCYNGSCQMMDESGTTGANMFLTWHIFGDPSLHVRTDTPSSISVSHDGSIDSAASSFDVTVSGIEGARCALYYDGVLYGSALTDASGDATIPIGTTLVEGDNLVMTVTSFNAMPYFGAVTVGPSYTPAIDVTPVSFEVTLEPDASTTRTLYIGNVGEALSVLAYQIDIVDAGMSRSLVGSTVASNPNEYEPGTTMDIVFQAYNGSGDNEWIEALVLDFPFGVTVNSCTDFAISSRTLTWDGTTGMGAAVGWVGNYSNIIYPAETATATANVTITDGFVGDLEVAYTLTGDDYGANPHVVTGTVVISSPPGPTVTLTIPNGGEEWDIGGSHDITWIWTGGFAYAALSYSTDGGSTWYDITSSTDNDGAYAWTVAGPVSDSCIVKIVGDAGTVVEDESDTVFSIYRPINWLVVAPESGSVSAGDTDSIELQFDATGLSEGDYYADILIDSNGGARVTVPVTLHVQGTGVETLPVSLVLFGNHPNPFNPTTRIAFSLPQPGNVKVSVFDVSGRLVRVLTDGEYAAGQGEVAWDGTDSVGKSVATGVYLYRMEAAGETRDGKMVLLK